MTNKTYSLNRANQKRELLTQTELKKFLHYNPVTGIFTWIAKTHPRSRIKIGDAAGHLSASGYIMISVNSVVHRAHRLAWLYMTGKWPDLFIDHINRDPTDNRIENLRNVTHSENCRNKSLPANNTSGINGVSWNKKAEKWQATIRANNKMICLGEYANKNDAATARRSAEKRYGYHENHGRPTRATAGTPKRGIDKTLCQ